MCLIITKLLVPSDSANRIFLVSQKIIFFGPSKWTNWRSGDGLRPLFHGHRMSRMELSFSQPFLWFRSLSAGHTSHPKPWHTTRLSLWHQHIARSFLEAPFFRAFSSGKAVVKDSQSPHEWLESSFYHSFLEVWATSDSALCARHTSRPKCWAQNTCIAARLLEPPASANRQCISRKINCSGFSKNKWKNCMWQVCFSKRTGWVTWNYKILKLASLSKIRAIAFRFRGHAQKTGSTNKCHKAFWRTGYHAQKCARRHGHETVKFQKHPQRRLSTLVVHMKHCMWKGQVFIKVKQMDYLKLLEARVRGLEATSASMWWSHWCKFLLT